MFALNPPTTSRLRNPLTPFHAILVIAMAALLFTRPAFAEDKKPDDKKSPPRVIMTSPLAVPRGTKSTIVIRGVALDSATEVHAQSNGSPVPVTIKSKGKAELPKDAPPEKLGNTQIEIELQVPEDSSIAEAKLIVVTPTGSSEARAIPLYDPATLMAEKEPNGGFATAQPVAASITISGTIGQENDVDVFRVSGKSGQTLVAEVTASRAGSALDSLLTLYDEKGRVIAVNDDDDGPDSLLRVTFPRDGTFYISLTDANGKGGGMFPYLLKITLP